jgi:hypothetical protein
MSLLKELFGCSAVLAPICILTVHFSGIHTFKEVDMTPFLMGNGCVFLTGIYFLER